MSFDHASRPKATSHVHLENSRTRVTEWRFSPGAETGQHVHEYDYVIVPVTPGVMRIISPDGTENHADLAPGRSYFRNAGVAHNVINVAEDDLVFVEVEVLDPA